MTMKRRGREFPNQCCSNSDLGVAAPRPAKTGAASVAFAGRSIHCMRLNAWSRSSVAGWVDVPGIVFPAAPDFDFLLS
jgi:hypothetical protein